MYALNPQTLMILTGCMYFLLPVATWLVLRMPLRGGASLWCSGVALGGTGAVLVGVGMHVEPGTSMVIGRTIVFTGCLMVAQGFRMDLGKPWSWRLACSMVLGYAALLLAARAADHGAAGLFLNLFGRLGSLAGVLAIASSAAEVAKAESSRNARLIALAFLLQSGAVVVNLISTLSIGGDRVLSPALPAWAGLVFLLLALTVGTAYLGLAMERSTRATLQSAERAQAADRLQWWRDELVHLDRDRTLALLSDSIAHAMTQPLTAALVRVETAKRKLARVSEPEALRLAIEQAASCIRATSETVDRVRHFVQQLPTQGTGVNIARMLDDVAYLLHQEAIRLGTPLKLPRERKALWVGGDGLQLSHAMLQVMRGAMVAAAGQQRAEVRVSMASKDGRVQVRFTPAGAAEELPGVTRSIIQDNGGSLQLEQGSGGETVTVVELPLREGTPA